MVAPSGLPTFGIEIFQVDEEGKPVVSADLSVIGLIGPATGADGAAFPHDTPVHVDSNDITTIAKLGTNGYLPDAINGINAQLAPYQFAARMVVVVTAPGVSGDPVIALAQTIANVMGNSINGTGVWAFLKAPQTIGFTPRLISAPGYTGQMANNINTVTQTLPGSGYVQNKSYPLVFSGGNVNGAAVQATGHAIGQLNGSLGPAVMDTYGAFYDAGATPVVTATAPGKHVTAAIPHAGALGTGYVIGDAIILPNGVELLVATIGALGAIATLTVAAGGNNPTGVADPVNPIVPLSTSGVGQGATFDLTWAAGVTATYTSTVILGSNPVCAMLPPVLNGLIGHAVVESTGISQVDDQNWRQTMNSQRLIPLVGGVKIFDDAGDVIVMPAAPRMLGIMVARDFATGGPFHSSANQPVQGIIGPARHIEFSLTTGSNEGQELLADNIGIIVSGEIGNDFAIADAGYILISTDNAGSDPEWQMYNVSRGRDFINLSLLRTTRLYLGTRNIDAITVQAIISSMRRFLSKLTAQESILGFTMTFNGQFNSADEIRLGHLTIGFQAEEPPVLKLLTIRSARYPHAIDVMVNDLAAALNLGA